MRSKGKITQWDDAKGFGFIQPMLHGERVFLHIKTLQNRQRRPVVGDVVTYSVLLTYRRLARCFIGTALFAA